MKILQKLINPAVVILFAVVLRLIPHPANVAPISALALFGAVYLNKKYALLIPLLAMFVSDLFLGFHSTIPYVYGSFILTGLMGLWLKNHKTIGGVVFTSVTASCLFFVITNFGVWLVSGLYQHNLAGFIDTYIMAIPFYRNTLIGDLLYTGIFFGGYEAVLYFLKTRNPNFEIRNKS